VITDADKPVTKRSAPLPSFLSESMKISRLVEVLERLPFDSREQGRIVVDRVTRNSSSPVALLLLLILNKQFTKRWPDVARSGDERSLPAAGNSTANKRVLSHGNTGRNNCSLQRTRPAARWPDLACPALQRSGVIRFIAFSSYRSGPSLFPTGFAKARDD